MAQLKDYIDNTVDFNVSFTGVGNELKDFTVKEVMLGESLLTPGLQTSIKADSYIHNKALKNFDLFKNSNMQILAYKKATGASLQVDQVVYRLDNRRLLNNRTETMIFRACDQSLLNDAETLVSKSWKCATPSSVAEYVLRSCAGVPSNRLDIEASDFARDYIAENIHPFQVVNQQANYAVTTAEKDPSFLHYMTYQNLGTHHFRSLKTLTKQAPVAKFSYNNTGAAYVDQDSIMTYSFPCDFDLLSDILNGIDTSGRPITSVALFDPVLKSFSLLGNTTIGCGLGEGVFRYAISNQKSATNMDACPDYAKEYLLKRQARMGLIEKEKIALKITVPWNPKLHVGKVIEVNLYNEEWAAQGAAVENYGSGKYLILNMYHHIVTNGFSVTTMDCVSTTVGQGEV